MQSRMLCDDWASPHGAIADRHMHEPEGAPVHFRGSGSDRVKRQGTAAAPACTCTPRLPHFRAPHSQRLNPQGSLKLSPPSQKNPDPKARKLPCPPPPGSKHVPVAV